MLNSPLILVSALFFLGLISVLYAGSWIAVTGVLRVLNGRISHEQAKRLLITALILPPLLAGLPTLAGVTLRHVHDNMVLEHHTRLCGQIFADVVIGGSKAGAGIVQSGAGVLVTSAAWLLLAAGVCLVLRLLFATVRLERGLAPYQKAPSPRLASALESVSRHLRGLPANRFFECAIPAAYCSVLGLWRVRCILSEEFVRNATGDELEAVVAHEGSHLRAGDVRTTLFVGALNCLFFYLRPVRLLGRRWREEAELACDDAAVAATGKPLAMAAAILRVSGVAAGAVDESHALPAVTLGFADDAACSPSKRVERLLAQAQQASLSAATVEETRLQAWGGWLTTLFLIGFGASVVMSGEAACFAHCSLEIASRVLGRG